MLLARVLASAALLAVAFHGARAELPFVLSALRVALGLAGA